MPAAISAKLKPATFNALFTLTPWSSVEGYLIYLIVQAIHKTVLLPGEARKPRDPYHASPRRSGVVRPD